ncbi:unnamed protein product [Polarella glacialis]|uniref:Uncharacterized protein n=1 Tax=Polarella glacialis TaxID=89957 RepID=A0A813ESW9_POLGL|nr:unnamed protein product [Polarella glacialis]
MAEDALQVYNRLLRERAKAQGLSLALTPQEDQGASRALVRLACLTRVFDAQGGKEVSDAFYAIASEKRNRLTKFLNADGITEAPGFLLYNAPAFLENARTKKFTDVRLIFELLLNVYEVAAQEYFGSAQKVVTIILDDLANHAKTCMSPQTFEFTKFGLTRAPGLKGDLQATVTISPWQLVTDPAVFIRLADSANDIVSLLAPGTVLREPFFLRRLRSTFPELAFFKNGCSSSVSSGIYNETIASMLVIYWTVTDQMDAFTRGQDPQQKLGDGSWKDILQLAKKALPSPEAIHIAQN